MKAQPTTQRINMVRKVDSNRGLNSSNIVLVLIIIL